MEQEVVKKFYEAVEEMFGRKVTPETRFVEDMNLTSGGYYMIIAEMEELGAEDITYGQLKKSLTMEGAADLLLENLES